MTKSLKYVAYMIILALLIQVFAVAKDFGLIPVKLSLFMELSCLLIEFLLAFRVLREHKKQRG